MTCLVVLLLSWLSIAGVRAAEDEFTAIGFRYQIREPLGPKEIPRDESGDIFLEFGLLPMISIRTGLEYASYEIPILGMNPPEDLEELIFSATIRYYKATGRVRYFGSFGFGIFYEEREINAETIRDADLGLMVGGGVELTLGRHFGLEFETLLESSGGREPDSVLVFAVGPKFFF